MMRVLDLFSGLGGWAAPFAERGHEVVTVDIEERFGCTYTADILEWEPEGEFDIVLASPPCEKFSVGGHFAEWGPGYEPIGDGAHLAVRLVERTIDLITDLEPSVFVVENPVGMLRKLHLLPGERRTVWYCHYGETAAKPTDLWGGFPPSLELAARCHAAAPHHSMDCCCRDHEPAPRGARTGTQGKGTAAERAEIPYRLALAVCLAAERDLAAGLRAADYTGMLFA